MNALFEKAKRLIPGGVNSPVRAFNGVGGEPIFFDRGQGAYLYDVEDRPYVDYVCSWGASICGHSHPKVVAAIQESAQKCSSFGAPSPLEIKMAELITQSMPNLEMVRMVNSGTEATMSAIRLARAFTGRDKILKFAGCYHGHADSLLVKAGSGALTLGIPSSPGVPADLSQHTLVANYNDLAQVEQLFAAYPQQIATIIVEPVACNMNCVGPAPEFLQGLRKICDEHRSLLIFDEVITGFRLGLGGAQEYFNVKPDLTTLGKIIGGGLPVGAYGGARAIMEHVAPLGPVYQAGTLSGNPLAMSAGIANLLELKRDGFYQALEKTTQQLVEGIKTRARDASIPLVINQVGSLFGLYFTEQKQVTCYEDVMQSNSERYKQFFHGMLAEGVYLAPSPFEILFVSSAHSQKEIEFTLNAVEKVFSSL